MDSWTYPPWSATLDDDGWMWGRGTTDCKNTLIAIFSTLDKLIEDDFEPTRYATFAFVALTTELMSACLQHHHPLVRLRRGDWRFSLGPFPSSGD